MTPDRPRPARFPVRGSLALALTAGGLALLLGFRTPPAPPADTARAIEPEGAAESAPATPEAAASAASISPELPPIIEPTAKPTAKPTTEPSVGPTPGTLTAVGEAVRIRWGAVQVAVTVSDGRIVTVETLQIPSSDRRSASLNARAEPILREEALARSSADIDVVSGATYTSVAYAQSLQSALDQLSG